MHSYGAKGGAVIHSTLYRLFNPFATRSEALGPLKYSAYAAYVLVPYIGHLLISEDASCTLDDAFTIMVDSRAAGATIHPLRDDDDELDDIIATNSLLARREKAKVRVYQTFRSLLQSMVILIIIGNRNR